MFLANGRSNRRRIVIVGSGRLGNRDSTAFENLALDVLREKKPQSDMIVFALRLTRTRQETYLQLTTEPLTDLFLLHIRRFVRSVAFLAIVDHKRCDRVYRWRLLSRRHGGGDEQGYEQQQEDKDDDTLSAIVLCRFRKQILSLSDKW